MATRYVSSNPAGSNTSPYDTLAKAATTFATAITGAVAGDVFAFSNLHSEAIAAGTVYTLPGTAASPNQMYSFDNTQTTISGSNLLAGATLTTTGANALSFAGVCSECIGFTFAAGSGATNVALTIASATGNTWRLFNCTLQKLGTSGSATAIQLGNGNNCLVELHNTTLQFGVSTDGLRVDATTKWINTPSAIQGATLPTTLIAETNLAGTIFCEGVDFSALSGKTVIGGISNLATLKDCKLPASVTIASTPVNPGNSLVFATRCDSAGTNYQFNSFGYSGTETTETSITRVGGTAAPDGTQVSKKIVTTANSKWTLPFEALPLSSWNNLTGSTRTVTVYGTINTAGVPNNDDIWIEVEYPKDSGDPLGGFVNSTKANNLVTGGAVSADTSIWNGGGSGAGWSPFKLSVTLTAQLKGPLTVRVYAAKASNTYYIDPTSVLS